MNNLRIEVLLWGECYNVEETSSLTFFNSGLKGEIPSERKTN